MQLMNNWIIKILFNSEYGNGTPYVRNTEAIILLELQEYFLLPNGFLEFICIQKVSG